jgi:hypothetical protein
MVPAQKTGAAIVANVAGVRHGTATTARHRRGAAIKKPRGRVDSRHGATARDTGRTWPRTVAAGNAPDRDARHNRPQ